MLTKQSLFWKRHGDTPLASSSPLLMSQPPIPWKVCTCSLAARDAIIGNSWPHFMWCICNSEMGDWLSVEWWRGICPTQIIICTSCTKLDDTLPYPLHEARTTSTTYKPLKDSSAADSIKDGFGKAQRSVNENAHLARSRASPLSLLYHTAPPCAQTSVANE